MSILWAGANRQVRQQLSDGAGGPAALQTAALCKVRVDNQDIQYDISSVQLEQFIDDHHVLRVRIRQVGQAAVGRDFDDPQPYTAYLAKPISLIITPQGGTVDSARQLEFIGLVTEVSLDNSIDGLNTVLVTAHSPTVALDGVRRNTFQYDMTATDIVGSIVRRHPVTLGTIQASAGVMKFSVQYRETDYEYILRLAASVGLFAHYDGKEFRVTKTAGSGGERLLWRESLGSFSVGLGTAVEKFESQAYDYGKKTVYEHKTGGALRTSLADFSKISHAASQKIYPGASFASVMTSASQAELDQSVETIREGSVGRAVVCTGRSIVPAVRVGHAVTIEGMDKFNGQYYVKAVRHVFDESGKYSNEFVCTPLDISFPQKKPGAYPFTDLQTAVVVDTNDPDKLGRVKVKLHWNVSEASEAAPAIWVRLLTPHSGNKRGFFCLPELDDEVLVGFEHGDPSWPVVLGSLYNGKDVPPVDHTVAWDGAKNNLKLLRTRTGNEIYFNDTDGKESVCIVQKDGTNTITLTLDGPKIVVESKGDISLKGKTISLESTGGDIKIKSQAAIKAESGQDLQLKATGNLKSEAGMNLDVKAGVNTTVQGGAMVTVKGAIVKIN